MSRKYNDLINDFERNDLFFDILCSGLQYSLSDFEVYELLTEEGMNHHDALELIDLINETEVQYMTEH